MNFIIAVDGPAASGKGTIAGGLAAELNLPYLDTGLLYRAVGFEAARRAQRGGSVEAAALDCARALVPSELENPELRTRWAGEMASRVAVLPDVRQALLELQHFYVSLHEGAVLDGRDIGTVIAPHAAAKLFVTASPETRAERRWKQLTGQGETVTLEEVLADIRLRDARDSGRASAPLVQAADAVLLDTTKMSISEAADAARRIVQAARARWEQSQTS